MSNPFNTSEITLTQQIENVRDALNAAILELATYGKSDTDAERLVSANISRSWKLGKPWYGAAYTVVSARAQWLDLLKQEEAELAQAERDARQQLLTGCSFNAGDQVRRRDGTIGIVRHVFIQADRVKVAVDWPAPHRIGGDGWHRSTVLASALTAI